MRKLGRLVAKGCYAHFAAGAWLSLGVGVAALTIALIATSMEEVVGTDIDDRDANATDSPSRVAVIQTDGASLNTGNRSRRPRQQPPRRENLLARRICYCCLVIPLVLAFVVSALSVLTLAIKNEDVRRKCKTGCLLTCSEVNWSECWIVLGGGAFVCSVLLLFMLSLVIRMCFATKLYCCCALLEVVVLVALVGVSLLVGIILTLGIQHSGTCLKPALKKTCHVQYDEVMGFLTQSEVTAWLSSGLLCFILLVWVAIGIKTSTRDRRQQQHGHGEPTETDPLINNNLN